MYVKYVTLSISRVGIPCRFAARDPSTLGVSLHTRCVFHIRHSPPSSIITMQIGQVTLQFNIKMGR